ncbi:MAG: shikimate dehydrogenase [Bacteroidia bacterium]|nr:shikimate dehydrogenase [Bacteroidia bacterium]
MRLFGLIGNPLSHSFSKKYFDEKFRKEGLTNCRYELFPIQSIDDLRELLQKNPGLKGLNITIPYKQQILSWLFSNAGIPEGIQACNCINISQGKLFGYNTDVVGFKRSLLPLLQPWHKKALVLGNGGAAAAVIHVLRKLSITYDVVSRSLHNGSTLTYKEVNEEAVNKSLIIINTTPLGMYPQAEQCPDIPYRFINGRHLMYDLVYNPAKTVFLQKGEQMGATIKNGEEMLILQAEESWRIWNS